MMIGGESLASEGSGGREGGEGRWGEEGGGRVRRKYFCRKQIRAIRWTMSSSRSSVNGGTEKKVVRRPPPSFCECLIHRRPAGDDRK